MPPSVWTVISPDSAPAPRTPGSEVEGSGRPRSVPAASCRVPADLYRRTLCEAALPADSAVRLAAPAVRHPDSACRRRSQPRPPRWGRRRCEQSENASGTGPLLESPARIPGVRISRVNHLATGDQGQSRNDEEGPAHGVSLPWRHGATTIPASPDTRVWRLPSTHPWAPSPPDSGWMSLPWTRNQPTGRPLRATPCTCVARRRGRTDPHAWHWRGRSTATLSCPRGKWPLASGPWRLDDAGRGPTRSLYIRIACDRPRDDPDAEGVAPPAPRGRT